MQVKTLKCNSCSADLPIKEGVRFFNCSFCGSSLEFKQEGGIAYLNVLKKIEQHTGELSSHSEIMLVEKEIERLDRQLELDLEHAEKGLGAGSIISIIGFGLSFLSIVGGFISRPSFDDGFPPLIAIGFVIFFIGIIISIFEGGIYANNIRQKYKAEREVLVEKLNQLKQQ